MAGGKVPPNLRHRIAINFNHVRAPSDPFSSFNIFRAIIEEQKLIAGGQRSFYALIIATPKRGLRKLIASIRYFAEPKLKRVVRELRKP